MQSDHKKYKKEIKKSYPTLGALGIFENYIAQEITQEKSVVDLSMPVRLKIETVSETPRDIFKKNDTSLIIREYITLEVLDAYALLDQINQNKELIGYLRSNRRVRLVTKVSIEFDEELQKELLESQELYLVQNQQKTLSIEVRENNKVQNTIEFSEGKIIAITPMEFCWGTKKGFKVQLMDIIPVGANCSQETYKTYKRAKRKTEFNW